MDQVTGIKEEEKMAAPEGYVALDLIGFTDKGDYAAGTTYVKNDLVHSDNRIYLSLQDNNVGNVLPVLPATETTYWKLWLSGGSDNLDDLTAKDTSNLMGTGAGQVVVAQALIDAMASKIVQQNSDLNNIETDVSNLSNEIVFNTIVLDPSGNDYVDIPVEGMHTFWSPLVMNGDGDSWPNGYVRAIGTPLNQNVIRVFLSENRTGSIRLNYCYRKK